MMAKLLLRPSPNWNVRPADVPISAVVLHATADRNTSAAVTYLCDRASKVSYHDLIDRDGTCYRLVEVLRRAWHAGVSSLHGVPDVNDYSIGLSFANDNAGEPYPDVQLSVGAALVAGYLRRFPSITLDRVVRHRDVALPVGRKTDPLPPAFDLAAFKVRVQRELLART